MKLHALKCILSEIFISIDLKIFSISFFFFLNHYSMKPNRPRVGERIDVKSNRREKKTMEKSQRYLHGWLLAKRLVSTAARSCENFFAWVLNGISISVFLFLFYLHGSLLLNFFLLCIILHHV